MKTITNTNWVYNPPVSSSRSSQNRIFVYALILPTDLTQNNNIPFYIGITSQLNKRLSNHKEVNWFKQRFKKPVEVKVLGTVADNEAFVASQELVRMLLKNSYYITSHNPTKTPYIKKLDDFDIQKYAKTRSTFEDIIETWKSTVNVKGLTVGKPSTPPEEAPESFSNASKEKLVSLCEKTQYGSQNEKNLILNIAHEYDETLGYSKYWLSNLDIALLKSNKKTKIRKIFSFPEKGWGQNYTYFRIQPSTQNKLS